MTQRASESLVAALIRIGLLLALAVLLMAENAQAKPVQPDTALVSSPAGVSTGDASDPAAFVMAPSPARSLDLGPKNSHPTA